MKDAKGHGSDTGTKGMRLLKTHVMGPHSAKVYNNPEWGEKVVKTFRDGTYQPKNDYHTDDLADAHGTAQAQLRRWTDQDAQAGLASGPKSAAAPVHDAMVGSAMDADAQRLYRIATSKGVGPNDPRVGSRDYDAFGRPRADKSEYDEASRDMALRSRNGQLGSGMKYRG